MKVSAISGGLMVLAGLSCAHAQNDASRLAQIMRSGSGSDGIHILYDPVKLTARDVALIRADCHRAMAAYPLLDMNQLLEQRWFAFDEKAKVPPDGFPNAHSSQDPNTKKWYLESALVSVVLARYRNRASAEETKEFIAARKRKKDAELLETLNQHGYMAMVAGSGGSFSIDCKPGGFCVVEQAEEWASTGMRYTFPFVVDEFLAKQPGWMTAVRKLPSFAQAVSQKISVTPSGTSWGLPNAEPKTMTGGR